MSRPESGLWDFLRARMPVGTHYSRIESLETAPGFPDVHLTYRGWTWGWELKCQEVPSGEFPFEGVKKGLRKSQRMWIRDELDAGGKVMLVLQHRSEIYFLNGHLYQFLDKFTGDDIAKNADLTWIRGGNCDVQALGRLLHRSSL